jgi:6-phosphogluconolactonase (cycloisomerase 2 family)
VCRLWGAVAAVVLAFVQAWPAGAQQAPAAILYSTQSRLDRVAAYQMRSDGRPAAAPFQQFNLGSEANPRRLALHPRGCALYVAGAKQLAVLKILPDGRLERFADDTDTMARLRSPSNFQYIALHPNGSVLYTSLPAIDQIQQYFLNDDGSLQRLAEDPEKDPPIASCVQGVGGASFKGLGASATHLYASAHAPPSIEIFSLDASGRIESLIERPDKDDDDEDAEPEVFTECQRKRPTFAEASSGQLSNPKALILNGARDTVYFSDIFRLRIFACPIDPDDGTLPDCPNDDDDDSNDLDEPVLKTKQSTVYEQLALSDAGVLFASVFREGRIRAFLPNPDKGRLERRKRKVSDIFSTPGGLEVLGDLLYAAQGEGDRVAVFPVDAEGFANTTPKWQTDKIKKSFPNDVVLLPLPVDPSACGASTTSPPTTTTTSSTTAGASSSTTATMPTTTTTVATTTTTTLP